jgi:hypothetical protein
MRKRNTTTKRTRRDAGGEGSGAGSFEFIVAAGRSLPLGIQHLPYHAGGRRSMSKTSG